MGYVEVEFDGAAIMELSIDRFDVLATSDLSAYLCWMAANMRVKLPWGAPRVFIHDKCS